MSAGKEKQTSLVPVQSTALTKGGAKSLAVRGRAHLHDKEESEEWLRKGLELQKAAPNDNPLGFGGPINPYAKPLRPTGFFQTTKKLVDKAVASLEEQIDEMKREFTALHGSQIRDVSSVQRIEHLYCEIDSAENKIATVRASIGREKRAKAGLTDEDLQDQQNTNVAILLEYFKELLAGVHPDVAAKRLGMKPEDQAMAQIFHSFFPETFAKIVQQEEGRKKHLSMLRAEMLKEAFQCFEKGHQIDSMNPELLCCLASCYEWGSGVDCDEKRTGDLYKRAADMGFARAQYWLGDLYKWGGEGVSQDSAQAATWFRKAAEQGDADAQVHLGFAYKEGWGVQQDIAEAAIWFRRAAASGDEFAQDELRKHPDHYGPP